MRSRSTLALLALPFLLHAQDVPWMESWPVDYNLNPSFASQVLESGPNSELLSVRQVTGTFAYGQDLFGEVAVERLDPSTGTVLFSCLLNDSVAIDAGTVDAAGNMYVAGRYMGALFGCDGAVLGNSSTAMWNVDLFLMAFSPEGLILWERDLSLQHEQAGRVSSLSVDPQGRLWYGIGEFGVGKVIRVDAQGQDMETRTIDGVTLMGTIDFDPWGGLYVSGASDQNGFAFANTSYQFDFGTGYQMFVLRYDPAGNAGFAAFASDVTFQHPTVVDDGQGGAYLAGELLDTTSWGGIALNGPDWIYSTFIARLDSTGQFLWAHESDPAGGTLDGDMQRAKGPCVAVDADANAYLMGDTRGMVHWGNGVESGNGSVPQAGSTIVKFAQDGNALWAANSAFGSGGDYTRTITADASGAVYFGVHTVGPFTFGAITVNTDSGQDAVVGKLSDSSTNVRTLNGEKTLSIWPTPATDRVNLRWNGPAMNIDLLNVTGQPVRTWRAMQGVNTFDLTGLHAGLYLLRTAQGVSVRVVKH